MPATLIPIRAALFASATVAIAAAAVELTVIVVMKLRDPMVRVSDDYIWSVPLALIATIAIVVLPLATVARRRTGFALLALCAATGIAFLDLFMLIPRLSRYAAALLALGIAVQVSRAVRRQPAHWERWARAMPIVCLVVMVVAAAGWILRPRLVSPSLSAPASGPNVILITLDTVRAGRLSLYGYSRDTTPNLARFAARGVVFDHAFSSAPWTLPSHATLMTGRWPHELSVDYRRPLDATFPTLAEQFVSRGYATGGFVGNLAYCGRDAGLARGFTHYQDYPRSLGQFISNSTLLRNVADNFTLRRLIQNDEHLNRVTAPQLNRALLAWIDRLAGAPFFAFVNYFDAHEPYLPPPPFDRRFGPPRSSGKHSPLHHALWNPAVPYAVIARDDLHEESDAYDDGLAYLDSQLGHLFDELSRRGLSESTLVVITADHGEEFGEHRVLEHGYSLYRSVVHVPLLFVWPGHVPEGRRIAATRSLRDIPATILDLVMSEPSRLPGQSLAPAWTTADGGTEQLASDASPGFFELQKPPGEQPDWFPVSRGDMQGIVIAGHHYIRNGDGVEELYALGDVGERHNIAASTDAAPILTAARAAIARIVSNR